MTTRTDMKHFAPSTHTFGGIYRGVIENNNDPEMLGRCQIRVWGLHDELKEADAQEGIPTENLSWAEPALGLIEGSMSGHGLFSVPLQGSHVFCFFESGNWESLRYFATAPGLPVAAADTTQGFNDPDGVYPREDRLGEPDYHRLSRGVTDETIVAHKNDNLDLTVEKSTTETWDEPVSAYAATYPNNIVLTTHAGITIELDNTVGAERIHIFHPSNTYIEVDAAGNVIFRNEGNRFEITRGDRNKHVLGADNETVDGDKTSYVKEDEDKKVDVNQNIVVGNDRTEDVGNDETVVVGNNRTHTVGNNHTQSVGGNHIADVDGSHTEDIGVDWTVTVGGNVNVVSSGSVNVTASGVATITGSSVVLKGTANTLTVS